MNEEIVLTIQLGSDDYITGTISPLAYPRLQINYNGIRWAIVPTFPNEKDHNSCQFTCQLPALESVSDGLVEILDPSNDKFLWKYPIANRLPLKNQYGLLAHTVLQTPHSSLTNYPWISFDGVKLTISGYHLPPLGDPDNVFICVGKGVSYKFNYPLISPSHKNHFWYWPNSYFSAFQLEIDLLASDANSDPTTICLMDKRGNVNGPNLLPKYLRFPTDLRSFIGFPLDVNQMTRVQSNDIHSVVTTGYQAYRIFEDLFMCNGILPLKGVSLLDWGCGHGRVLRHFVKHWPQSQIWGVDIDKNNIEWAQNNITGAHCQQVPLMPPSSLFDQYYDGIYGLSVMTHLTAETQVAWLKELARCLKQGGLALLTFDGETVASYDSRHRSPEWWTKWKLTGFDDTQHDPALDKQIVDQSYYRLTLQTENDIRIRWSEYFTVIKVIRDAFGNQDVVILRKK